LFEWYFETLSPPFFGRNWSALNDILNDLEWIKDYEIWLVHTSFPLSNLEDMKIYLQIINGAAANWKPGEAHQLKVVFPKELENLTNILLGD
jgi:hypothetical protein